MILALFEVELQNLPVLVQEDQQNKLQVRGVQPSQDSHTSLPMGKRKSTADDKIASKTKMDIDGEDNSGSDDVNRFKSLKIHSTFL
jgi:hypothetical protein